MCVSVWHPSKLNVLIRSHQWFGSLPNILFVIPYQVVWSVEYKIWDKFINKKVPFFMSHTDARYRFEEISPHAKYGYIYIHIFSMVCYCLHISCHSATGCSCFDSLKLSWQSATVFTVCNFLDSLQLSWKSVIVWIGHSLCLIGPCLNRECSWSDLIVHNVGKQTQCCDYLGTTCLSFLWKAFRLFYESGNLCVEV